MLLAFSTVAQTITSRKKYELPMLSVFTCFTSLSARRLAMAGLLVVFPLVLINGSCGQDVEQAQTAEKEPPEPTTMGNPEIPLEQLELMLKPLTIEELVVEADGWRGLLRSKLVEISEKQIALLKEKAEPSEEEATPPADDDASTEAAAADSTSTLVELQEQRTHLVDRTNAVIKALEKKGGDVTEYRNYINAVTGIDLNASDASTTWALILGWLKSEQGGMRWLWNIIKFLLILGAFYFGASFIASMTRHAVARVKGSSQLLVNFTGSFVKQLLMVIGFIVALAALEVNIGPLLAAVGAAGFVIGLALQGTLSNFASGLLILFYRPFDVGDVIDAGGVSGIVDSVSLVSTHIRTFDNNVMIVPNNDIWGGTITNASASKTRRVDMVFGIGYSDDIEQAKGILEKVVADHPLVLDDPAPVIELNELADSSVNFICRPWANNSDYWKVYWEITKAVKQEFDRQGISIPFPQRDIHVYHETAPADAPAHA
jgi:small conductance mechanosensitive channel